DLDGACAIVALRDLPLEGRVVERMILDMDGQMLLTGLERHALRDGPARERPVVLEAEVVVQAPRIVPLDDEDRILRLAPLRGERLGCLLAVALALVVGEFRRHLRSFALPGGAALGLL